MTTRVVLLATGSFNPPTNMHLRMFEIARDHLQRLGLYKVVGGIISPVHDAYGKKDLVNAKHRCMMVQHAVKHSDWIKLDTWECSEEGWTETRKVLEHHQNVINSKVNENLAPQKRLKMETSVMFDDIDNHGENKLDLTQSARVMLLCGADLLESFAVPGLWKEDDITSIVSSYGLVVITRQGSNPHKFIYESDVLFRHQNNIHIVTEWITNEVSATKVRRALRRGESVKYLIPDPVVSYIASQNLYGASNNKYSSVLLTPSPNSDALMLDALGNVIQAVDDQGKANGMAPATYLAPTHLLLGRSVKVKSKVSVCQDSWT